ncbi:hypothetical protein ZeamMp039 (mitochondrion) [Zea mays subsp. mays]|uniref:Uncharacterized protein orf122 n=1 Tax=Zea mays TaxID=4577 RepID=Q6R9K7_MAIZE|nr:hypothetical protein ZeamMp039 [Zea mays subsp. mays]AAR91118.1 hypothetical protein [Zea mays]|eukprot:YP_588301.1 hypothetical protein ZeamMp039 (mitochondrion) [Zea mays subsp. mays]
MEKNSLIMVKRAPSHSSAFPFFYPHRNQCLGIFPAPTFPLLQSAHSFSFPSAWLRGSNGLPFRLLLVRPMDPLISPLPSQLLPHAPSSPSETSNNIPSPFYGDRTLLPLLLPLGSISSSDGM